MIDYQQEVPHFDYILVSLSTQAGSHPITNISWISTLRLLVTLSKDGTLQVWKTRVVINPNRQPMEANFFEKAGNCHYCKPYYEKFVLEKARFC
jgi:WD40 repeat protein